MLRSFELIQGYGNAQIRVGRSHSKRSLSQKFMGYQEPGGDFLGLWGCLLGWESQVGQRRLKYGDFRQLTSGDSYFLDQLLASFPILINLLALKSFNLNILFSDTSSISSILDCLRLLSFQEEALNECGELLGKLRFLALSWSHFICSSQMNQSQFQGEWLWLCMTLSVWLDLVLGRAWERQWGWVGVVCTLRKEPFIIFQKDLLCGRQKRSLVRYCYCYFQVWVSIDLTSFCIPTHLSTVNADYVCMLLLLALFLRLMTFPYSLTTLSSSSFLSQPLSISSFIPSISALSSPTIRYSFKRSSANLSAYC